MIGIRHGEVLNPDGVIYAGLAGYGLSDFGRAQASSLAEAFSSLPVAAIYASPLDRAVQTATVIAAATGIDVVTDDRLHEWRFWSQWAGLTWDQLREQAADEWSAYQSDPGAVAHGESLAELADRMESWMVDIERAHPDGVVVGVSHLEPLRAILLRLTGRGAKELFDIRIGLGDAVRLQPEPTPVPRSPSDLVNEALLEGRRSGQRPRGSRPR